MLKCDDRFARQNRDGPPPEFPLASPSSSIVHHLSGPIGRAPTRTARKRGRSTMHPDHDEAGGGSRLVHFHCASCSRRSRGLARTLDSLVRVSRRVRCGPLGSGLSESASGIDRPHSSPWRGVANAFVPAEAGSPVSDGDVAGRAAVGARRTRRRIARRPTGPATRATLESRPMGNGGRMGLDPHGFTHCWTLFSKFFSSFPRGTCSLSVSRPYSSSLGWSLPPVLGCNPKQPDSRRATRRAAAVASRTGLSPSPTLPSKRLGRDGLEDHRTGPLLRSTSRTTGRAISTVGHFPLHSPLLRESWLVFRPPLSDMLKFGGSSWPSRGPNLDGLSPLDDGVVSALRRTRPTHVFRLGGRTGGWPRQLQLTGVMSLSRYDGGTDSRPAMLAARSDGRHLRSKSRRFDLQFTLRFSQLAAFFIDARAQRSTVRSTILSRTDSTVFFSFQSKRKNYRSRSIDDDPSAGSPTETLLRLLLPLNDQVRPTWPGPAAIWRTRRARFGRPH